MTAQPGRKSSRDAGRRLTSKLDQPKASNHLRLHTSRRRRAKQQPSSQGRTSLFERSSRVMSFPRGRSRALELQARQEQSGSSRCNIQHREQGAERTNRFAHLGRASEAWGLPAFSISEKHSPSPSCKEKFFAQELSYLRYEYSKETIQLKIRKFELKFAAIEQRHSFDKVVVSRRHRG